MTVIRYRGSADDREITAATFASHGLLGIPTIHWNKANGFEVDLDPAAAAFVLAQGSDFVPGDPNDTFASLLNNTGSGRILNSIYASLSAALGATVGPTPFLGGGIQCTFNVTTKPVEIKYGALLYHTVAGGTPNLRLYIDAAWVDMSAWTSDVANSFRNAERSYIPPVPLAPGLHTAQLQLAQSTAVATCNALGTAQTRAFISVREG